MKRILLSLSVIASLAFVGCKSDTHIVNVTTSGDGFLGNVGVPVGSNPNMRIGLMCFVGRFNNTVTVTPTSTNSINTPQVVVYTRAHGKQSLSGGASSYTPSTATVGTNTVAVTGTTVASPAASITDGSGDGSAVVFGTATVTDSSGATGTSTNRSMTINK